MFRGVLLTAAGVLCAAGLARPISAQETGITPDRASVSFSVNGSRFGVSRSSDRACPPACIQPLQLAPDIATLGELEVLAFLETTVAQGSGLVIDVRDPQSYASMTIPGAVNIPEPTLQPDNPYRSDLLAALGLALSDTSRAFDLVLFADSAASDAAARAVQSLRVAGYPADKIKFYRAGLAGWAALGLSTQAGG